MHTVWARGRRDTGDLNVAAHGCLRAMSVEVLKAHRVMTRQQLDIPLLGTAWSKMNLCMV